MFDGWLIVGWSTAGQRLVNGWSTAGQRLVKRLVKWLVKWLVQWLIQWLVQWLAKWLATWLANAQWPTQEHLPKAKPTYRPRMRMRTVCEDQPKHVRHRDAPRSAICFPSPVCGSVLKSTVDIKPSQPLQRRATLFASPVRLPNPAQTRRASPHGSPAHAWSRPSAVRVVAFSSRQRRRS